MGRLNILLLALVIFCAMLVVEQQHEARTLFVALGQEQQAEQQIEVAFTRLQLQQVTLATVAPGIAEALVATAIGLFSAIPAVVAYNRFARDIDRIAIKLETFIEEFSNILQRSLGGSTGASGSVPTGSGFSASGH